MPFNNVSDPEMVAKGAAVIEALTPEFYAYLLSLIPTRETITDLHTRFQESFAASLTGDSEKAKACEADRKAMDCDLSVILGFVKVVAIKDPTVTEKFSIGPLPLKAAPSASALTIPRNFKLAYGVNLGELNASVSAVKTARGYQVWACEGDPSIAANWKMVGAATTCKGIVITGLTAGRLYWFKIRAMRGDGAGPWSALISMIAN